MDWCIGLKIKDFYCNGFFGRDYELYGSVILDAGMDYLVIRKPDDEVVSTYFDKEKWTFEEVRNLVEDWTK